MTTATPKDMLINEELIGFKRSAKGGAQIPRRASSAKVTNVEPSPPKAQTGPNGKKRPE